MAKAAKMDKQEREWEAEDDARALQRLVEINGSKARRERANKKLKEMEEKAKKAQMEARVARKLKEL